MKHHANSDTHKLHMVSINYRTFFIWYPKGVKPYITHELLNTLFGIEPGHCVRVG